MKNIVIYPGHDEVFQTLFDDCRGKAGITVIDATLKDGLIKPIWSFLYKHPTLQYEFYPFLSALSKHCVNVSFDYDYYVFTNISIRYISIGTLRKMQQMDKKVVLFFLDTVSTANSKIAFFITQKFKFDHIYTFDRDDANNYGFIFRNSIFSKGDYERSFNCYDGIFVGSDKGRYSIIKAIYERLNKCNLFILINGVPKDQERVNGIIYDKYMPYRTYLNKLQDANVIIDVVADNQNGLSLRCYEAVVYNKRLITNNPSILKFSFYNDKYMKYICNTEDVDLAFFCNKEEVQYKYKNEFSPLNLIKEISQ